MGRDLRPKHKISRRFSENVMDTQKNPIVKRNYPAGMHGQKGRIRVSEYGRQLSEKQKARATYGILERQFLNYYKKAVNQEGDSSKNFLYLLERRLDNVVYRLGLADTRRQARQMVSHKHILINGKTVNIPSYSVKEGDIISVKEKTKKMIEDRKSAVDKDIPEWLSFDKKTNTGKVEALPSFDLAQQAIDMQLVIEFYSR